MFVLGCYGIFALAVAGYLNALANRPLLWLGSLSYALYLVHQNIGFGVIGWSYTTGLPGWAGVTLALATALALAALIHYGIEKPALAWFRKPRPHPANTLTGAHAALNRRGNSRNLN